MHAVPVQVARSQRRRTCYCLSAQLHASIGQGDWQASHTYGVHVRLVQLLQGLYPCAGAPAAGPCLLAAACGGSTGVTLLQASLPRLQALLQLCWSGRGAGFLSSGLALFRSTFGAAASLAAESSAFFGSTWSVSTPHRGPLARPWVGPPTLAASLAASVCLGSCGTGFLISGPRLGLRVLGFLVGLLNLGVGLLLLLRDRFARCCNSAASCRCLDTSDR